MHTVTSFHSSAVQRRELGGIIADYLALERARNLRRVLVARCGLLAVGTAAAGFGFRWLSPFASWFAVVFWVIPPIWAWGVELYRDQRLSRRLEEVPGGVTQVVEPPSAEDRREPS